MDVYKIPPEMKTPPLIGTLYAACPRCAHNREVLHVVAYVEDVRVQSDIFHAITSTVVEVPQGVKHRKTPLMQPG